MEITQGVIDSISSAKDKDELAKQLESIISMSETMEKEYSKMTSIIENIEHALVWIISEDGSIFTQTKASKRINSVLSSIDFTKEEFEINYSNNLYLFKIQNISAKKVITATDITLSKERERLLSMGNVATHLAHEIRNPIGSISLSVSSLMENSDLKSRKIILDIKKAINRVERTIKATLLFSKDHQNINISEFSALDLFKEVKNSCEYYSYSKEINFNFKIEDAPMNADFELLLILFQNLVFNSIDAIEEDESTKGEIAINYRDNKDFHIFSIEDSGADIQDRDLLFQAFKTTKLNGNGIGLNLSRKIALAHNGDIKIDDNKKIFFVAIRKGQKTI